MPRTLTVPQIADELAGSGLTYIPGSAGEPTPLLDLWAADPGRTRGARILTSLVPGINGLAMDALHSSATVTGLFMQPAWQAAQAAGRFRHLPLSYSGFVRHVRERVAPDACVVHVSPPDRAGRCSLGPAVEFTPLVQARSRRTLALMNPLLPAMPGAPSLEYAGFDAVAEVEFAPRGYQVGAPARTATAIAGHIAGFIGDGCTLQVGLGKVPDALMALLHGRRGLRLHSGMLADSALDLWDAGALDPDAEHASCVWVGSAELYRRLQGRAGPVVAGCEVTHDASRLAALPRLHAVNSALSVDLFGQANLEVADGRAVSGLGGAGDFARGARQSPGGLSIVALPSTHAGRARSRIVPRLDDGIASLPRGDVDVVVTEHGAADLRGLCVHGRAEALAAVADPAFQPALADAWREVRARL
ncbi:MAG TPA: acetyl-CoA hydrolase/transferase C-terminal domain-containing protein [Acetobacteraceae bacterium]